MSGTTAALRIVARKPITFEQREDDGDQSQSWSKGDYSIIRQDFTYLIENKTTELPVQELHIDTSYLARIFSVGSAVFLVGAVLLVISFAASYHYLRYIAMPLMFIGAAIAALSLLRAQELSRKIG
jgi:hypothetical protein